MDFYLEKSPRPYRINRVETIRTPQLLVFEDRVERNIEAMRRLLANLEPPLGLDALCPHVKTHKSIWTTKKLAAAGISFFKSTLNELQMLADAGAKRIFIAYPLLPNDVEQVAEFAEARPDLDLYVQAGHPQHLEYLCRLPVRWNVLIDVNVGMDRTGCPPEKAWDLYLMLRGCRNVEFAGLHAYDGHVHQRSETERFAQAQASMSQVIRLVRRFAAAGAPPPMTIVAGTPAFLSDAQILGSAALPTRVYFSPGTWVYSDSLTDELLPGVFETAAVLLAQVIDRPAPGKITLNIGHKRWGADQGPIERFSVPGMKALSWSEEHTVVAVPTSTTLDIGDYVVAAPRHVCSTINLWETFLLIDREGNCTELPIDARNR
ncbi:MAG: alanine racemase [candidate division KSB1 bacterium]|nr:alanine racemase [candidate division KSB1 bacterium]MDZ7345192.1 alanine racemase [candidate division KSB1 bacterium]